MLALARPLMGILNNRKPATPPSTHSRRIICVWLPEVKARGAASDDSQGQASLAKLNEMLAAYQGHFE
jgi:hypothetical protein